MMPQKIANPNNIIGITMGCPVGIGPEIVVRFLSDFQKFGNYSPVVLGDEGVLIRCAHELEIDVEIVKWEPSQTVKPSAINVLSLSTLGAEKQWGNPDSQTGKAMGKYIEEAVRLIQAGELAAMTTCPIAKSTLNAAGYNFPGHTEMLASLCQADDYAMMMAGNKLRVTLVTIHSRLADVPDKITKKSVNRLVNITGRSLRDDFGIEDPRIAVAGLNPHAGEEGIFGNEESQVIAPAIREAQAQGWQVHGPFPPDTVFCKAVAGDFDAVVCMYHDQGLIPFKLLHFADGVNVTLGLPIVRTSVDHGTAYDIAGKGLADPSSLRAAFFMASEVAENRRKMM